MEFAFDPRRIPARCLLVAGLVLAALSGAAVAAPAYSVVYAFCPEHDGNCREGSVLKAGVVRDAKGNFYGTTAQGGGNGVTGGTVYQVTPDGVETVLHSFCLTDCADGATPLSQLVIDVDGNLYGTTMQGGIDNGGTIFELKHAKKGKWAFKVLYSFCSMSNCADGANPYVGLGYQGQQGGLLYDGKSELFGAANAGGSDIQGGVIFSIKPGKKPKEKVIYDFCSNDCSDGSNPMGTPIVDDKGNIFGTTLYGGFHNAGSVYELKRAGKKYKFALLYSFCSAGSCADGHAADGPVVMDADGNLYGTTFGGGSQDSGVIFKIVPNGAESQESVLYNFCTAANCADGSSPHGGVAMDASGNLYGTTISGGANQSGGAIYRFAQAKLTVLHSFTDCNIDSCPQGGNPIAGVMLDSSGNLFGTTQYDSVNFDGGVIYKLTP